MVERKIERDNQPNSTYLIDFIPNLKYMLKLESLVAGIKEALTRFERRVS